MRLGPLKLKLQLLSGEEIAFGPGRADLLEAIAREGSISAAGRALGMSYRRAWLLVDGTNRCFTAKLVETAAGGGPGGGARLTPFGAEMLAAYRALERTLAGEAAGAPLATLEAGLRREPIPPKAATVHEH